MAYFDGDHDHGEYESPTFAREEDANAYLAAMRALPDDDERKWSTDDGTYGENKLPYAGVSPVEVVDQWDGVLLPSKKCLTITYT